ncbi:MAG TPA: RNA polymerase sigma factor [Candidatus Pacearchaeota archaeon]|nr:RNA polymerase sigma factor [Candidatus Parcubacteria bacterium]HOC53533.1 RNA polymerase sigma factor [Candidatus Pacearchaeota archaeon]HQM24394.1 RNA polymerase sigma factor [Candidatus Pacearchaeota archaeon]
MISLNDMQDLSDEQIIGKVLEDNKDIYIEIIKRYEKKLSHYLHKFISDQDEIEDVLQVVFIKTYKNLYGFDQNKKFSSWIYRIAHNEAVNYLKKKKASKICLDDVEYKLVDEKVDLNNGIDNNFLKKDIEKILGGLKIKYREPLILFFFEGKSYEEISDILRVPKNTVGTLILRGKKLIKEELEEIKKKHD